MQLARAPCVRTQLATVSAYQMEFGRVFSFWMYSVRASSFCTQPCQGIFLLDAAMTGYFPSGCTVSGHFPSEYIMSEYFPSGRSRVRAFSFWMQLCQGKWHPDDACHGTMVTLAVKAQNITANTHVVFTNMQWVPGIVTQSSPILYI